MESQALVAAAIEQARSDDFGPDTEAIFEALDVFVHSAKTDAELSAGAGETVSGILPSLLVRCLEIEQCYAEHPEIGDESIESARFGLGLPRRRRPL